MSEGVTYAKHLARNTISIVLTVEEWRGGEGDPIHLVKNDDDEWGTTVESFFDAARDRDTDDECALDHEDCEWYCDEDTARRSIHSEASTCECDECGLTAFVRETRTVGGARMCRVCKPPRSPKTEDAKPAKPASLLLWPEEKS